MSSSGLTEKWTRCASCGSDLNLLSEQSVQPITNREGFQELCDLYDAVAWCKENDVEMIPDYDPETGLYVWSVKTGRMTERPETWAWGHTIPDAVKKLKVKLEAL